MCAIHHLKYLHIILLFGGTITCSNQNSGVGRVDSFQFFYFILKAVVVQLLPWTKFKSENSGLNVPHIESFDPYYPPVTWQDFTILHYL